MTTQSLHQFISNFSSMFILCRQRRACCNALCLRQKTMKHIFNNSRCIYSLPVKKNSSFYNNKPNKFMFFNIMEANSNCQSMCLRWHCQWGKNTRELFWKESLKKSSSTQCDINRGVKHRSSALSETKRKVSERVEGFVKKENVVTVPNVLCLLRMASTPVLGYLILQESYTISFGLFLFAGCTDVVDGYIARTFPSQQSMIGSFLDPAADKLLVATLFLCLTANDLIPVPLTLLIIFRDVCLMAAGFYIRYVSLPPPKTFVRFFDVSFATARLAPTGISKINTMIQLSLVAFSLAAPVFGYVDHVLLKILWYVTGITTVLSAGSYLYYKNTYQLFSLKNKRKQQLMDKQT